MTDSGADGATQALIDAVRDIDYAVIPEDVREVARHCVLDFLGVAVAGAQEPLTGILVNEVVQSEASREATLIGRQERATRLTAALVNGAAGHALDFDDTHTTMNGHPSVPVLPALLALAETQPTSGRSFLAALVAGIELECRLGALLGFEHYAVGFHPTGTVGTFGAGAACAHLLGLDNAAWRHALGLAGTQAAGLRSGFGTMAKPLHAGRAAASGLLSALLARAGFTAQSAVVEVAQGFAATHAGPTPAVAILEPFARRFLIRDTLFKYHAACYLTHAAIEAASQLRMQHVLDADTLGSIELQVAPALLGICNILEPTTGLEGKFSLRATTALALLGADTSDLATYSDATMTDPRLVAVRNRVRVVTTDNLSVTRALLRIETPTGPVTADVDTGKPATDLASQRRALQRKFLGLAAPVLGATRASELAEAALRVDELDSVRAVLRLTGQP